MIYVVENLTDTELSVTLSGETSYHIITIGPRQSLPIQKPDGYQIIGDVTSFSVTKY